MQDEQKTDKKIESLDFNKPDFVFTPKGEHIYQQQGYYLICDSCDLRHGVYIGPDKLLVGLKKGQPILKTRKELGMV